MSSVCNPCPPPCWPWLVQAVQPGPAAAGEQAQKAADEQAQKSLKAGRYSTVLEESSEPLEYWTRPACGTGAWRVLPAHFVSNRRLILPGESRHAAA